MGATIIRHTMHQGLDGAYCYELQHGKFVTFLWAHRHEITNEGVALFPKTGIHWFANVKATFKEAL